MADPLEYDATPRVVFGAGAIGAVPEEAPDDVYRDHVGFHAQKQPDHV